MHDHASATACTHCIASQPPLPSSELKGQALPLLLQFASMLADIGFIGSGGGGGRSRPGGKGWVDDKAAVWNRYASSPAVVGGTSVQLSISSM